MCFIFWKKISYDEIEDLEFGNERTSIAAEEDIMKMLEDAQQYITSYTRGRNFGSFQLRFISEEVAAR